MSPRFRFFAALLALFAFAVSTAEGVWAAACQTEMEMISVLAAADPPVPADPCAADEPAAPSRGGDKHPGVPHCPLGPVGTVTCTVGASLPAAVSSLLASSDEVTVIPPSTPDARYLLLASAFFRPPQA